MQALRVWLLPRERDRIIAGTMLSLPLINCGFGLTAYGLDLSSQEFIGSLMAIAGAALFCRTMWSVMEQFNDYAPLLMMVHHQWLLIGAGALSFLMLELVAGSGLNWLSGICFWLGIGSVTAFQWLLRHGSYAP